MKFAHFSDLHLGFQKEVALQAMEQKVFESSLDDCISRGVDFILICGDMFHVNIPEMRVQKYAFAKLRQVHEAGIPVYVVYGSHDFSPTFTSVIDLLVETGYITKVQVVRESARGRISLGFITDRKTGAKLTGLSGLAASRELAYYEDLDREELESESGFKIFLFHGAISEMRGMDDPEGTYMPVSLLPRGFDYYAGGHVHKHAHGEFSGHRHVVYSGTPFAGFPGDLEENARGVKRGYVLVEFENADGGGGTGGGVDSGSSGAGSCRITSIQLIEVPSCRYEMLEINANHRRSTDVGHEIAERTKDIDPAETVVILKVKGMLSEGKTTDIDFKTIANDLRKKDAIDVKISRGQLSSAEYTITESKGDTGEEIMENTFYENIGEVDSVEELIGRRGADLAKALFEDLRRPSLANEPLAVYAKRITDDALKTLGLESHDS